MEYPCDKSFIRGAAAGNFDAPSGRAYHRQSGCEDVARAGALRLQGSSRPPVGLGLANRARSEGRVRFEGSYVREKNLKKVVG
jgi:hypothetical protein